MTQSDKAAKTGKQTRPDTARATDTVFSGGEMLNAASEVIAARLEIMARGMVDPRKADMTEMSLMSSEKVEALSAATAALNKTFGDIGGRMGAAAMTEAGLASRAATAMASASSPAGALQVQYNYAVGWWSRAAGQMLTLNTELLKGQADALRPIHSTAVANAKRLKK